MTAETILIIAVVVALAFVLAPRNKSQEREAQPDNWMTPGAWEIGPIMRGENVSVGLPLRPDTHPDGFSFEVPHPTRDAGHVHYITVPTGSLAGKTKVTLRLRIEMDQGVKLVPVKFPDAVSLLTLYFQRGGDDWSGVGEFAFYRWYAGFGTVRDLKAGEYTLEARFDQSWGAVMGGNAKTNPSEFAAALADASRVGFVLGGGDGLGHGVYATGPARIVVTDFKVE